MEVQELKTIVESLVDQLDRLTISTKKSANLIGHQNRMLEIAINELMRLAETEAIPVFFRKQILGTIVRMREIGIPT